MNLEIFVAIGLPLSLALIMFGMGLTLTRQDFLSVATHPRPFIIGLSAQMIAVPLLALFLLIVFELPTEVAIGLLILSFSPGGTTSNLFSYLARGDIPLSISLTVIASLITPFSIPLLTEASLQFLAGESREVTIPFGLTAARLFAVTVLPLLLGMTINYKKSAYSETLHFWVHRISMALFFSVIASMTLRLSNDLPEYFLQIVSVSIAMVLLAMLIGSLLSASARLHYQARKTITIEVGLQNGGMALLVTEGVLQNDTMSLVPIIYGLLMLLPIGLYILLTRNENT